MTITEMLKRSGATYDPNVFQTLIEKKPKYSKANGSVCHFDKEQIASALERANGFPDPKALEKFENCTFEQQRTALQYPGKCFGELARKALLNTTDLFRKVVCIKQDDDYKLCIHSCNECHDHFYGKDIEIDHFGIHFRQILLAFLDSHVEDWCILPDARTVAEKCESGYRGKLKQAHKIDYVETVDAYWQRAKNESKTLWADRGLDDKFVAFHNRVAKLQALCLTCHDKKTNESRSNPWRVRLARPVHDETLGKSKKRKLNDEKVEEIMKQEAAMMDEEFVTKVVTTLREAITSMQRSLIADALSKVPPKLLPVLPMVETAKTLLHDLDLYEKGKMGIALPPLPTNPCVPREGTIAWNVSAHTQPASSVAREGGAQP